MRALSVFRRFVAIGLPAAGWLSVLAVPGPAAAHLIGDYRHDLGPAHYDFSVKPPSFPFAAFTGPVRISEPAAPASLPALLAVAAPDLTGAGFLSSIFQPFAPAVRTRSDARVLYVESDGMPAHRMMVGITAWQQQVPLPQAYTGDNAWQVPLHPVAAGNPLSAKSHFFRGAIAIAANGVPIFNPIKNDGRTDTFLAGELDEFGGHCGRADDYHYHIAPTHLQNAVGAGKPIAVALDGYPIYGFTEPGGAAPGKLDAFNGHTTPALGYHYHATRTYPYLNGGFHGEVVEREGQVDPQPRAQGIRPALPPLPGARITGFRTPEKRSFQLTYEIGGETRHVNYLLNPDGSARFDYVGGGGQVYTETYRPRGQGRPGERDGNRRPRPEGTPPPRNGRDDPPPYSGPVRAPGPEPRGAPGSPPPSGDSAPARAGAFYITAPRTGRFKLSSPAFRDGDPLPQEFTGDGAGVSPPLEWKGAPAGTRSFALVMDHLAPDMLKSYWVMWDIPGSASRLPKDVHGVGKVGATWQRGRSYVPPHSKGPGKKIYTITLYALSAPPVLPGSPESVTREMLLRAIQGHILDSAELKGTYTQPER